MHDEAGNNNDRFDPNESAELVINLRNAGAADVEGVTALLRSGDPRFVVTDADGAYGTIPAGQTLGNETDRFAAHADASLLPQTVIPCTLLVNGTGYSRILEFSLVISELRFSDPIPDGPRVPPVYWAYDDVDVAYNEHPDFDWVETRGRGTRLTLADDQTVQVNLPTGFVWRYYGRDYTQISICSNGWVAPGYTSTTAYSNTELPTTSLPGLVALVWDDLYPPVGNGVWYFHDADNHRFVVEYDSVAYWAGQSSLDKFQLVIHDTTVHTPTGDNVLLANYLTAEFTGASTVGIQDPSATVAIQCVFNSRPHVGAAPLRARRAIKYTTVLPATGVKESPKAGPATLPGLQVTPNPFNDRVEFALPPAGGALRVRVYDNSGRVVRDLGTASSLTWDGRDESGRKVAPGVYFYRAAATEREAWGKVILAR